MDEYKLTEAIKAYVAVLAIGKNDTSSVAIELTATARTELTKIGTTLTIEASPDWIDDKGNQVTGSTRDAGKATALQPGVYLYQNLGMSKSPLPDAPIYFEFIKNSGTLNAVVATDAFGKATSVVTKIDAPDKEAVVRAYPVFTVRGYKYSFASVLREFTFLPPTNKVLVAGLQISEFGASKSSDSVQPVALGLKSIGYEAVPYNGALDQEGFLRAFGGDPEALRAMGQGVNPSYFAFVFVEVYAVKQYVKDGKAYNMYFAYSRTTVKIIRDDGSIVYSTTIENEKASGGTAAEAVARAYADAKKQLEAALPPVLGEIKASFAK
jgi:hypothetical protein